MIPYIRKSTVLNRMDPLSKFFWLVCLGILVFTQPLWFGGALFVILLLTALVLGRLSFKDMKLGLSMALFLAFFMMLGGFWTAGGEMVLFQLGPLRYTMEGLVKRGANAVRIMNIMFSSFIFIWTTNPRDFVVALTHLRVPYRIAFTIFVALNYIPVLANEYESIKEAQRLRGIQSDRSPSGLLKRYTKSLAAIMVRGLRKAQITSYALDSKAFGAYADRTYLYPFHWSRSGLIFLGFWILLTVGGLVAVFVLDLWEPYVWAY